MIKLVLGKIFQIVQSLKDLENVFKMEIDLKLTNIQELCFAGNLSL